MRILVIESDLATALMLRRGFQRAAHEAVVYPTAEAALHSLIEMPADCVTIDPNSRGVDGYWPIRELRARGWRKPIIVVSAPRSDQERVQAFRGGADDYVAKPVSIAELCERIRVHASRLSMDERLGTASAVELVAEAIAGCTANRKLKAALLSLLRGQAVVRSVKRLAFRSHVSRSTIDRWWHDVASGCQIAEALDLILLARFYDLDGSLAQRCVQLRVDPRVIRRIVRAIGVRSPRDLTMTHLAHAVRMAIPSK